MQKHSPGEIENDDYVTDETPDQSRLRANGLSNKPKNNFHPLDYPIVIKRHEGYLTFSLPDFNHFSILELPKGAKMDSKYLLKVAAQVVKLWAKSKERIDTFTEVSKKAPSPSLASKSLSSEKYKKLTVPQVAQLLQKSENTIRRMADRGDIPCYKSRGGTRYFLEKDIF